MALSVAEALGKGARELRRDAGLTLEEVAHAAREFGLPWSTGRVGDFEAGRAAPTLPTLLAFTAALARTLGRPVTIVELISGGQEPIRVNENLELDRRALRAALSNDPTGVQGLPVSASTTRTAAQALARNVSMAGWPQRLRAVSPDLRAEVLADFKESDVRMCKNIGAGMDPVKGAAAMAALWGHTFTKERADRADPDANSQALGQISRRLKAELQEVLGHGDR